MQSYLQVLLKFFYVVGRVPVLVSLVLVLILDGLVPVLVGPVFVNNITGVWWLM